MTQGLDGQEVEDIGEGGVVELVLVQRHGHAHGVDEYTRWLLGVVTVPGQAVSDLDATEVRNLDRRSCSHGSSRFSCSWTPEGSTLYDWQNEISSKKYKVR